MSVLHRLARFVLRAPRARQYLKRVYDEVRLGAEGVGPVETSVVEATPLAARSTSVRGPRVNLLVPSIDRRVVFGGIQTALDVFAALMEHSLSARIVLTEQGVVRPEDLAVLGLSRDWRVVQLGAQDSHGFAIVPAGDRSGKSLAVGPDDRFLATAWWTAAIARGLQDWQLAAYPAGGLQKFAYLIQDFEPGFYPWSSRYAYAESTYHEAHRFVPIINSTSLRRYFERGGYQLGDVHTIEPYIAPVLASHRSSSRGQPRRNRILVYGRPSVPRNAFEMIVMGLRRWVDMSTEREWEVVSAGEPHAPVDLGRGVVMRSLGKLSLRDYAVELARCRVGVSLMLSPHPSYPPLEMAYFGLAVVTNNHGGKNLTTVLPGAVCLDFVSPETIANGVAAAIRHASGRRVDDVDGLRLPIGDGMTDLDALGRSVAAAMAGPPRWPNT